MKASDSDIEILQRVCAAVSIRAARLAAAGIAAIVKVCFQDFYDLMKPDGRRTDVEHLINLFLCLNTSSMKVKKIL